MFIINAVDVQVGLICLRGILLYLVFLHSGTVDLFGPGIGYGCIAWWQGTYKHTE